MLDNPPYTVTKAGRLVLDGETAVQTAEAMNRLAATMPDDSAVRAMLEVLAGNLAERVGDLRISVGR
jgi:hypothetical protein